MKPDIRWQILLALVGLSLVLMLLSYQVQSAALCLTSVPAAGGTFVEGVVGRPTTLNPLLSDPYPVDRDLVDLVFDGLVRYDEHGQVVPDLAESWAYSEDGLTLTFNLRDGISWHDGKPVTAADVAFTYGLMQDDSFPGLLELKRLWQSVTISEVDARTVQFTLSQPYAPFIEATTRSILPAHLLASTSPADLATIPFNQAPVGTGPFMVQPGQDWTHADRLRLTPNPAYWRQGTQLSDIEFRFYPDAAALVAAYGAGEVDAVNGLPPTLAPEVLEQDGSRLFTSLASRYTALFFNMGDTGAAGVRSKEARQALAYGLDRAGLVDRVLHGQGVVFEGPYLPDMWFARPDLMTRYSFQPETAAGLLDAAGWLRADDGVRAREGVPLTLRLLALDRPEQRAVADEVARQWGELGVDVQVTTAHDLVALHDALTSRTFDAALLEILPPADPDLYDFWSQEAMVRGQNFAGWNNRRASEALEAARQVLDQAGRAPYYEAFLRQFDGDLPALTLYQHVNVYVLAGHVQQAEIGNVWTARDRYATFSQWFLNFRDVTVSCSPAAG